MASTERPSALKNSDIWRPATAAEVSPLIVSEPPPPSSPKAVAVVEVENDEDRWNNWPVTGRKLLAEFIGDLLFVFVGSLSFTIDGVGTVGVAFAHGFTITLLIISLGHLSGGHFNPSVTMGVLMSGNIHPILAGFYVLSQMMGSIVGGFLIRAVVTEGTYCLIAGGTINPADADSEIVNAMVLEIVLTYMLVQTVLNAAVESGGKNVLAPWAIGLTVLVDILAGGDKSGASMNCARSFGPAIAYSAMHPSNCTIKCAEIGRTCTYVSRQAVWHYHYIDWVGPLVGAFIAGFVYRNFLTKKPRKGFSFLSRFQ